MTGTEGGVGDAGAIRPDDVTGPDEVARIGATAQPDSAGPDLARLAEHAQPAMLRRAPRYAAFFTTGAVIGLVLGTVLGLWLSGGMVNRWIYVTVVVASTTLVTVLLAGVVAVVADRRSAARADAQRATDATA